MPENTLRVVARIKAKPDRVGAVKNLLRGLVEPTRREAGCIVYELLQNTADPTDFTFVEEWSGREALDEHLSSEHIRNALPQLSDLAIEDADIRTYTVVG